MHHHIPIFIGAMYYAFLRHLLHQRGTKIRSSIEKEKKCDNYEEEGKKQLLTLFLRCEQLVL